MLTVRLSEVSKKEQEITTTKDENHQALYNVIQSATKEYNPNIDCADPQVFVSISTTWGPPRHLGELGTT